MSVPMDTHIRELFLNNDATGVEHPPDFDWSSSMSAVLAFKPHAENLLGQPLKLDNQVQDASFFAELFILEDGAVGSNGVTAMVFKIGIRFSSFARLATIHTNSPVSDLQSYPVRSLVSLLEQHGFRYVDFATLCEPYEGCLKGWDGGTWWARYFDYL